MKDRFKFLELDKYESGIVVNALKAFREDLKSKNINAEAVEDLIIKIIDSQQKKITFKLARER